MFIFLLFSSYLFLFNFYPFQFTSYPHFFFLFWRASPAKWHINFLTQNKYLNIKEVSKLFQDKNDWCSYSPDLCNALTAAAMLGKQKVNRVLLFLLNKFFCGLSLNIWNGGYISGLRIRIRSEPKCFPRIRIRYYHTRFGSDKYKNWNATQGCEYR